MRNILIPLILLISINFTLMSQNVISTSKDNLQLKLSLQIYNNQQVINKIATGNKIPVENVNIIGNLAFDNQVVQNSKTQLSLTTTLKNSNFNDFTYRGFLMPQNVIADLVNFNLTLNLSSGQNVTSLAVSNFTLIIGQSVTKNVNVDSNLNLQNSKLYVKDAQINYSSSRLSDFNKWASSVDDYNQANLDVLNSSNYISGIPAEVDVLSNMRNLDDVFKYEQNAKDALNLYRNTKQAPFYGQLGILTNDPLKLNQSLETLNQKAIKLQNSCGAVIDQLDILYYNRGVMMYQKNDINNALFNFNKSIDNNNRFTPSHYMIALIAFNNGDYSQAEIILQNIFNNLGGDQKVMSDATNLANNLYGKYINYANAAINTSQYDNAIVWLDKAQNLCNTIKAVNCSDELPKTYTLAYGSKMDALLGVVDNNLKINKTDDALVNFNQAIEFRKQHLQYLADDAPIKNTALAIYNTLLTNAQQQKTAGNFDASIDNLLKAKEFCSNSQFITCSSDIDNLIKTTKIAKYENIIANAQKQIDQNLLNNAEQTLVDAETYRTQSALDVSPKFNQTKINLKQKQYDNAITNGNKSASTGNYTDALNYFDLATSIETNFAIKKNTKLKQYLNSSAKNLILQKLDIANQNVASNNITQAKTSIQEAQNLAQTYGLENDRQVSDAINSAADKVFSQECKNYKSEYTQDYNSGLAKEQEKKYAEAANFYNQALVLAGVHKECAISSYDADNRKKQIQDAADYQQLVIDANDQLSQKNYENALSKYDMASKVFVDKNISNRFGLTFIPMEDFIKSKNDDFVFYAVSYYLGKDDLDNSLNMLRELDKRAYNAKLTKNYQIVLADKLAVRDYMQNANTEPKQKVIEYSKAEKWFSVLQKQYLKKWKSLK